MVNLLIEQDRKEEALRELIEKLLDRYILTVTLEAERNKENYSATALSVQRGQKLLA